jgi:hypothetical protein
MFHVYVASVLSRCCVCLSAFASVSSVFIHMLQALYLDVSKIDRMLHMGYAWKAGGA